MAITRQIQPFINWVLLAKKTRVYYFFEKSKWNCQLKVAENQTIAIFRSIIKRKDLKEVFFQNITRRYISAPTTTETVLTQQKIRGYTPVTAETTCETRVARHQKRKLDIKNCGIKNWEKTTLRLNNLICRNRRKTTFQEKVQIQTSNRGNVRMRVKNDEMTNEKHV